MARTTSMSMKDYKLIAEFLSVAQFGQDMVGCSIERVTGFAIAVQGVADAFAEDNPRFNAIKFVEAVNKNSIPF